MMVSSSRQSSDTLGPANASKPNQRGGNSDTMEWRKSGNDQTAAAHGVSKPRGSSRGGGAGGRGGRAAGGRGRGGSRGAQTERTDKDAAPSAAPPSVKETAPDSAPSGRTSRQKGRKAPAAPSEDLLRPPTPQTRPPNRRRRSHQSVSRVATASPNLVTNKLLTVETSGRKAVTGPPTPSGPPKDLPPHLAQSAGHDIPSFDLRTNIDALVERVRAVAMDRPHTPGSHIDWAGDDDDSLPDLDDWAVPSNKVNIEQEEEALPAPEENSKPDPVPQSTDGADSTPRPHKVEKTRSKRGTRSRGNSRAQQVPPALEITPSSPISTRNHGVLSPMTATQNTAKPDPAQTPTVKLPLHPSLPPKPLIPIEPSRQRANNTAGTVSTRNTLPAKPVTQTDNLAKFDELKPTTEPNDHKEWEKEVIEPLIPIQEPPTYPHSFNPSHSRAHTMGRMADVRPPHSAPTSTFPHPLPLADTQLHAPLRSTGIQHSRNHSSPPTTRAPQATRPVLTGDALSRLARTLGTGGGMSPRREPAIVPPVKD